MDASFDLALKQSVQGLNVPSPCDIPLTFIPDIEPGMAQTLGKHGAVLQLPPKPWFVDVSVRDSAISLHWDATQEQSSDVTGDRTLTYSLHCYADVPFKMKAKLHMKKRFLSVGKLVTPESGFEDMSVYSAESSEHIGSFPSLSCSVVGSQNASHVTMGSRNQPSDLVSHAEAGDFNAEHKQAIADHDTTKLENERQKGLTTENRTKTGELGGDKTRRDDNEHSPAKAKDASLSPKRPGLVLKPTAARNLTALLPEPIRLPEATGRENPKLPQTAKPPRGGSKLSTSHDTQPATVLNLPPLIVTKDRDAQKDLVCESVTSVGVVLDAMDTPTPLNPRGEDGASDVTKTILSESSSTLSVSSTEYEDNQYTNMGRLVDLQTN